MLLFLHPYINNFFRVWW